jgi:predicted nuclease with RNAse H fold
VTRYLYVLQANDRYPDPAEEISALAALVEDGVEPGLLLADRKSPPMKRASAGDEVILAVRDEARGLEMRARAWVSAPASREARTPEDLEPLYGALRDRWFVRCADVEPVAAQAVTGLSADEVATFTSGQAFVKNLGGAPPPRARTPGAARPHARREAGPAANADAPLDAAPLRELLDGLRGHAPFNVIGLDPTAATPESHMCAGPKPMPSVVLAWTGREVRCPGRALHRDNAGFWERTGRERAVVTAIDGPCATNGLRPLPDWSGWDASVVGGMRDAERALADAGVRLFWTTHRTVTRFDGAARWIARSLRLFGDTSVDTTRIETHPHGVFTFFWRAAGMRQPMGAKRTPAGRRNRLTILRAFIDGLDGAELPDHDAVDAAAAALVALLHVASVTTPWGTDAGGGRIWMPAVETGG